VSRRIDFRAVDRVPAGAATVAVPARQADQDFLDAVGFEDKAGRVQAIAGDAGRVTLALGLGAAQLDDFRQAGAALAGVARGPSEVATTALAALPRGQRRAEVVRAFVEGVVLGSYRYSAYKAVDHRQLASVAVVGKGGRRLQAELDRAVVVAEAVCWARDLVNEPANSLSPARLADEAVEMAGRVGLAVEVWDEVAIVDQRLDALAAVGQGSSRPPRLIRLTYEPAGGAGSDVATIALVGKGITFDSGGLSIKPADAMMTMKTDMSGAAAVLGAMSVLSALKVAARVVAVVPAAENMVGADSTRPGDVVRARNGTSIEILNTDAEGRLVLADALALVAEERPDAVVDVATLTGAQRVALGNRIAGLMGNHEGFVNQVAQAACRAGEPAWPMPLPVTYRPQLDSAVADLRNIGEAGQAGMLIAGLFLQEFVGGRPWAHLDIAGPARSSADDGYIRKGGTGWGVRTLVELVSTFTPTSAATRRS